MSGTTSLLRFFQLFRQRGNKRWLIPVKRYSQETETPRRIVKEFFRGRFNKKLIFPFPRISQEEFDSINELVAPAERFFLEQVDSKQIDKDAKIDEKTLQGIKDLGLFGQQIPLEYGGLEMSNTKYARMAEVTALDGSIAVTLAAHQAIGFKGLLLAGSEEQKQKYLPRLATGELVAAFCLTEPSSGSDAASIQTRATLSEDGTHYLLNGSKIWISNGGIADVFTVFARTEIINDKGEKEDKITAFFVERNFGGITSGNPEDKLGIRGSNTAEVYFENTPVPLENVIGEVGQGFKLAMNILNGGRFSMGSSGSGILKKLIGMTAEYANTRKQFGKKLNEFGMIRDKFARMAVSVYAMESMAYLTAGLLDQPGENDLSVEAAIVKVFSSEECWSCGSEALQVLGGLGYMKEYPYERYLRDARILMIFEGTNEVLRMFIALSGLQMVGNEQKQIIKDLKNPVANPGAVFKAIRERTFRPKLDLTWEEGGIHERLKDSIPFLKYGVEKFGGVCSSLLVKYGKDIVDDQLSLKRVADIAIDLYAMTAVLSRATNAIVRGMPNFEHDNMLATLFCQQASDRVYHNVQALEKGSDICGDDTKEKVAHEIFKNVGYVPAHPLTP